jgi:type II secretory pathway component PulM
MIRRTTSADWTRYYEGARHRRRAIGGDPLAKYLERRDTREKRIFVGSSVLLLGILIAFYSLLVP